jgi:hypothetical protein
MRIAVGVGAWLLGVGAATGGSLLAVSLLGQGIAASNSQQLTPAAVARALASEASDPSDPSLPAQGSGSPRSATPSPARSARTHPHLPATPPPQTEVTPSGRPASASPTASHRPHPSGSASPTLTPSPAPTKTTQAPTVLTSQGGSVVAECVPGGAYLLSWSPTQGFEAGQVVRGPAPTTQVTFDSTANSVLMVVSCSTGVPVATTTVTPGDDGGGGHDE